MSYIDNEILERLIGTMVEGFARIEKKLDQMNRLKECMNGDRLLDNVIWLNCWVCRSVHWPVTGRRQDQILFRGEERKILLSGL